MHVTNPPKKGSSIKVEPIRSKRAISNIKKILVDNPRDLCLFTMGINTAFRANELLSIKVGDVRHLEAGDPFELKQSKTQTYRTVTFNENVIDTIEKLLESAKFSDDDYLYKGRRGLLKVPTVSTMVKSWCRDVGLKGNYASHSLRKTWGYWQRVEAGTAIPLLMAAYGHSTQKQTLSYLGIQPQELQDIYALKL